MPNDQALAADDFVRAAALLDVSPAAIIALAEVEAPGGGFLGDGRPKILYERHVMHKRLKAAGRNADALAVQFPALVNTERGGYKGGAQEWYRLALARQIDAVAADESASWGRFQIMGYHWQACGFDDVGAFVAAMTESEARQLDIFVAFVRTNKALVKALKAKKWADVARLYNGPAYADNRYDEKLAAAYDSHAGADIA